MVHREPFAPSLYGIGSYISILLSSYNLYDLINVCLADASNFMVHRVPFVPSLYGIGSYISILLSSYNLYDLIDMH